MSYAICHVIIGQPLQATLQVYVDDCDLEPEQIGFEGLYTGDPSFRPMYCGLELFKFRQGEVWRVRDILKAFQPDPQWLADAQVLMDQARIKITALLDDPDPDIIWSRHDKKERNSILECLNAKPDVYLVWSRS